MFVSYVLTYFSTWKGLRSIGRIVWVTCLLPYVILTILLIKGFTLEGFGKGLKYLFIPDWDQISDVNVWKSAATQILFSSAVGYGPLMYYASGRGRTEKIIPASFIVPITNSATSMYAALSIFCFLGHVSTVKNIPIRMLSKSGPDLLFVVFPALLGLIPGTSFFTVVFFAMCVCLGIDSVFGMLDFCMKWLEEFPVLMKIFKR
jgi:SNF family Na+-dependent transporter